MSHSEKLRLQWNDFQENLNSSFKQLRIDEELSDVTLVSDDGGCVGAHKVVLALSSPFFSNILKRSKNSHPFVFLSKERRVIYWPCSISSTREKQMFFKMTWINFFHLQKISS